MGKPADWVRIVMHQETEEWVSELDVENLDAFEISGSKWSNFPFRSYTNAHYPEFDICKQVPAGSYDIIFAEQVWEHLKYPYRATRNAMKALRPGGYFLVTVPFMVRKHAHPMDCTRWSADGLAFFLEECGFDPKTIRSNHWGNRDCLMQNMDKWVRYDETKHSLRHNDNFPLTTWALAQKFGSRA